MKKIILGLIVFLVAFPNFASAVSIDELQKQISILLAQIETLRQQISQQSGQNCFVFSSDLQIGNSGSAVTSLQKFLEKEGFDIDNGEISTNNFSESTASAVVGFQERYRSEILTLAGLSRGTGYVGARTRTKLNTLYGCGNIKPAPVTPNPTACPTDVNICSDGKTIVSRILPSCYFATCPVITTNPIIINTTSPLPNAKVGNSYKVILGVSGGPSGYNTNNYNWSITSGALPAGLILTASDYGMIINGTPTTAGTYNFTLNVSYDSQSGSKQFTLTVDPKNAPSISYLGSLSANFGETVYVYGSNFVSSSFIATNNTSSQGNSFLQIPINFISPTLVSFMVPSYAGTGLHSIYIVNTLTNNSAISNIVNLTFNNN